MNMSKETPKVKICGIRREKDAEYANLCLPDYVGFVFAESPRRVTAETAARLRERLDPRILIVGVFADENSQVIARICEAGIVSLVQLHGNESEAYIADLRQRVSVPLIKAMSPEAGTVRDTAADFILLDGARAGSGRGFDRRLIGKPARPFFLAGGLTPSNVAEAAREARPYAVDVSSGVERGGFKDLERMRAFVEAAREVNG
ncbi:MAG: phosphoribosylanthranilate isomerase [Clostridiales Family XIII bacterium]|jgi:phosphoribosylanthranilate isomerase|nr:phosphoribosylanthranilate isomerase [Clostridiales Family XIII bacterium]